EKIDWEQEYYLSIITDTESRYSCPMVLFTTAGGMDIEELLVEHPEYLHRHWVDPRYGLLDFQLRRLVKEAAISKDIEKQVVSTIRALYEIYWSHDAEIAEINPLGVTKDRKVVALDGKVTIDNSALFRQKRFEAAANNSREARAAAKGLSYVELEGDVGIISNGAGLTMATMDQMSLGGARPANFMDTGARILDNGIEDALDLLSERADLRMILINVFGGGVRCDVIAQKISDAMAKRPDFPLPVVVCLQGRNHEIGHRIIEASGHPALRLVRSMEDAVIAVTVTEAI
ncbi:MAG: succinate--CoA ligase subunit beta, partial [Deltaproteobacteria bacterium]|nr:succinate--CoA ligase subunit beta [Deltaproteobacteria bacterium]